MAMIGSRARVSMSVLEFVGAAFVFAVLKRYAQLIRGTIDGVWFCKPGAHLFC